MKYKEQLNSLFQQIEAENKFNSLDQEISVRLSEHPDFYRIHDSINIANKDVDSFREFIKDKCITIN
jgi:hypothetical protein